MFTEEQSKVITNSFVGICTPCYGGAVHEKHYVSVVSFVIASMKNNMNFTLETKATMGLVELGILVLNIHFSTVEL